MIFNYMLYIKEDKDVYLQNLQVIIEILHRRTSLPFSAKYHTFVEIFPKILLI